MIAISVFLLQLCGIDINDNRLTDLTDMDTVVGIMFLCNVKLDIWCIQYVTSKMTLNDKAFPFFRPPSWIFC